MIAIDFKNMFHTMDHDILLKKMSSVGCSVQLIACFES